MIEALTRPTTLHLLPELCLRLADPALAVWQSPDAWHAPGSPGQGHDEPWWAFAWAGGQAIARYLLDHPDTVRGRRVLAFAAGCGVEAIAAARAGASHVIATEIDPLCAPAIAANAALNGVTVHITIADVIGSALPDQDVVLAGDVFYERELGERIWPWLHDFVARGGVVLVGDPGRTWLPVNRLRRLATYSARSQSHVEDDAVRNVGVFTIAPNPLA
jgi:predicted nicotinamide N-methyase